MLLPVRVQQGGSSGQPPAVCHREYTDQLREGCRRPLADLGHVAACAHTAIGCESVDRCMQKHTHCICACLQRGTPPNANIILRVQVDGQRVKDTPVLGKPGSFS